MKEKKDRWGYAPFIEWAWKDYDGKATVSIDDFIKKNLRDDSYFMIGSDSQNYSKKGICKFTTVLIAYRLYKGGSVIIHRDKVPYVPNLRQRLYLEAMRSLEAAYHVNTLVPSKNVIEIHLDVNPSTDFKSGLYKDELIGMIAGQGYRCLIKPDAWAASGAADRKC
jgi:predicted RNase H-related nuclease YkuK (DUF458 family)